MQQSITRLARVFFCVAAMMPIGSIMAAAGGNGSLYSSEATLIRASVTPETGSGVTLDAMPLLYTGFQPVDLIGPEAEAHQNSRASRRSAARREALLLASLDPRIDGSRPTARTEERAYSAADLECLTEALYFEARGEGARGQAAVAEVILNRVDSGQFPDTVCGVVNQPSQFSYTIGGKRKIANKAVYMRVRAVAEAALQGAPRVLTEGATYFHTPGVRPAWSSRFTRTVTIGDHIFYRRGQRVASN